MSFAFIVRWDQAACGTFNRANHGPALSRLFGTVSRIGDGGIWYALMLFLPAIYGAPGAALSVQLAINGLACTLLYKWVKGKTHRLRPCEVHPGLRQTVAPLDRFSFPSGHTLHAVAFTSLTCAHYGEFTYVLVPFTVLVAASRLVLGLHYLSDVIAGALIGGGLAVLTYAITTSLGWA